MSILRSRIVEYAAAICTLSAAAGLRQFIRAALGMLPSPRSWDALAYFNRHEIVGTAVKVGSKVERGIKYD